MSRAMAQKWQDPEYVKKVIDYKHGQLSGRLTEFQRRHIRNLYGRNCILCGESEVFHYQQLSLHHVTDDSRAHGNGQPYWIALLCEDCHLEVDRDYWCGHLRMIVLLKTFEFAYEDVPVTRRTDYSKMPLSEAILPDFWNEPLIC